MLIRPIRTTDAASYLEMLLTLDQTTQTMMFEPGERNSTADSIQAMIEEYDQNGSLILVADGNADAGPEIVGFLSAELGPYNRIRHTAYIVAGILPEYQGRGIGTELFKELTAWAIRKGFARLELTVMCHNESAIRLYQKSGFEIEGVKRRSMRVNGEFVDEYYMARLL